MDAAQIDATAARLTALGCTASQIDRHLTALAALRASRASEVAKPQQPVTDLTEDQVLALLPKLRERQWRWAHTCPQGDDGDWFGQCHRPCSPISSCAAEGRPGPTTRSVASCS